MKSIIAAVLMALSLAMSSLMAAPAHAGQGDGGGGSSKSASCWAFVESMRKVGSNVEAVLTIDCNVHATLIRVSGSINNGKYQDHALNKCYGQTVCRAKAIVPNPKGVQEHAALVDLDSFVSWPDPSHMDTGYSVDKGSASECPAMGCLILRNNL